MTRALLALCLLFGAPDFSELEKSYRQAVDDSDWKTVRRTVDAMVEAAPERAARFLSSELTFAADASHRRAVFRALTSIKRPEMLEFLREYVSSGEAWERACALEGYAALRPKDAFPLAVNCYQTDDDPRVRRVAVDVLVSFKTARAAEALMRAPTGQSTGEERRVLAELKKFPDAAVTAAAGRILSSKASTDLRVFALLTLAARNAESARPVLERATKNKDRRVAITAMVALDRIKTPGTASSLRKLFAQTRGFDKRYELLDIVGRTYLKDSVLTEIVKREAQTGNKLLRPKAAETLGHVGGADAVPPLTIMLRVQTPWQIPVGASRGLAATRSAKAIPPLIAALGRSKGRLSLEISIALESLTGQPFGTSAGLWKRWWDDRGAGFQVPRIEKPLWKEETQAGDKYAFYGIRIRSHAVAFVCDVSGSMGGDGIAGLKKELSRVLKRFPAEGRFNLIFFDSDVRSWKRSLVAAKKRRKAALQVVNGLVARGGTNMWDGLQTAMSDKNVDTIVLLSDGSPTAGKVQSTRKIRDRITKQNRSRMVLIHVIAIGYDAPHLRQMAQASGGKYAKR